MTPERRFYEWFKRTMPKEWLLQRIETTTANGVPDLNLFIPLTGQLWLEFKSFRSGPIYIRKEQYAWIKKRQLLGCNVSVIALVGNEIMFWSSPFDVIKTKGAKLSIDSSPNFKTNRKNSPEIRDYIIKLCQK